MTISRKDFAIILIITVFSSFIGGMVAQYVKLNSIFQTEIKGDYPTELRTKGIHLIGKNNKIRASFSLGTHDTPTLILYDNKGTIRFDLGLAPAGNPGMSFGDENRVILLDLDTKYNRPSITLSDTQNKTIWRVP